MSYAVTNVLWQLTRRREVAAAALYDIDGLVINFIGASSIDRDRIGALLATFMSNKKARLYSVRILPLPKKENLACLVVALVEGAIFTLMLRHSPGPEKILQQIKEDLVQLEQAMVIAWNESAHQEKIKAG